MIKVHCKQCNDFLLEVPDNTISIGVRVMEAGFIYKLPILYGDKEPLYFCCPDCKESYYDETYSVEQRQEAKRITDSLKADMTDMVESTHRAVKLLAEGLEKIKKKE